MQLFHYTDVCAVKSILENKKLWLTDLRFMNDSEEMNHGIKYVLEMLDLDGVQKRLNSAYADSATEFVREALSDHVDHHMNFNPIFVCSFSQANDLLSQWRAYGNYAVEFSSDSLGHELSECIYEPADKSRHAYDATLIALRAIGRAQNNGNGRINPEVVQEYSELIKAAAMLKHESFAEEQEVRAIVEKIDCDYPLLFRARGSSLIPYVEIPVSLSSVRSIHVGPMRDQELAYRSMCMYVDEVMRLNNYKNISVDGIKVTKSRTPFRTV